MKMYIAPKPRTSRGMKRGKFVPSSGPFKTEALLLSSDRTTAPFKVNIKGIEWFGYYWRGMWRDCIKQEKA